ncbi:MAG: Hpt domain-containing protein [Pseudomonadota bacterium]
MNIADESANLIDFSQIDALLSAAGRDGVNDIMQAFWRSTDNLTAQLRTQLEAEDFIEAARTSHAIKGSAANVGACRLATAARSVENGCRNRDSASAIAALDDLLLAYAETRRLMTAHIDAVA